ncbi:MAG: cysteine--tRNA ligase [Anaerolineae bacterium]|nr:cysteine--tRNA ligase [Anaerolineae bacterium]
MTLQIYNVLGREKHPFQPIHEGKVNLYVCGPTVQDYSHIGHAKTYISFDVVVRYLRYRGYDVLYVQNITDVGHLLDTGEDRVLKTASRLNAQPMQIVEFYTRKYFEAMDSLGVQRPDISPRASGHIPEQIAMIQALIEKGHAYAASGSVYFDVRSYPEYGKLSNRKLEEQEAGTREEVRDEKRHPADFALWKKAEPEHIMRWNSPWGEGFPGWHIECSAMAAKYLGETFDIHGGGVDNIFPHNDSEIAQSECVHDSPFANYWMLVGSLMVPDAEGIPVKMSKSLGNFVTIADALEKYRPEVIRTLILSSHYRGPLIYSDSDDPEQESSLRSAKNGWERLMGAVWLTRDALMTAPDGDDGNSILETLKTTRTRFEEAMDDDFNAPSALAALYELTREVNTLLNSGTRVGKNVLNEIDSTYRSLGGEVLGIVPDKMLSGTNAERESALIRMLIEMRSEARASKNYATSDRIRKQLTEVGITLEDRPDGSTIWRVS